MAISFSSPSNRDARARGAGVTAVLGPTNTGKTHLAIERMLAHSSGMIGLPLRLLAREVYNKCVERVGAENVALITGEEKIKPPNPRFWVATVEAMPRDIDVAFVAIDEVQLGADLERGHVFTDRMLNRRGREETLVLGAATVRPMVERLLPGAHVLTRPRLSQLTFAGEKKLTRLPRRSAVVAFSAEEVYAIAELIRRQRGGAAVVLGSLSPRTRNAQVALYQSGDVEYLVATDAIGMGLNLDVDHSRSPPTASSTAISSASSIPSELAQIAGRAGRATRDGTFGTTGRCPPFETEIVQALESHSFEPLKQLQWRNTALDFISVGALQASLSEVPTEPGLTRAPVAEDILVLDHASRDDGDTRHGDDAGSGGAAVGGVPGPGLSQDLARIPRRARHDAVRLPDARRQSPDRLVCQAGRRGRSRRRRHRHAVEPHRAYPHLDLRRQPAGLARRSRALAGAHACGRGQIVGRAARAPDRALRRSPHQRADAAHAREHGARNRYRQDRRGRGRGPQARPSRRLLVHARCVRRRLGGEGARRRRAEGAWRARSMRAPAASRARATTTSCWRPTASSAGRASRSAASSPPRRRSSRACASSPTSSSPARRATACRPGSTNGSSRISRSCSARCSSSPMPRTSPGLRAASPSSSRRRSA